MAPTRPGAPVLRPERLEVNGEANLAAAVHLCSLPLQLRQLNLRRYCWVCRRDVKLEVELILDEIVHIPALAGPSQATVSRLYREPVAIALLVDLDVFD